MVRKTVEFIGKYDYGIDPIEISKKYGIPLSAIVNLKSNENPFPPPESLIESVVRALDSIPRYPDPNYTLLKEKISEYVKLPPDHIAVGNGATEIIQSISNIFLEPFDKVVIPVPTYTLYFFYSMLRDASIETIKMKEEENFTPKSEEIINSCKGAKLLFLCSPNNPTGSVIEEKELCSIIESIDTPVIVDEAYSEFYGRSIVSKVKKY
ncbi:MAG: histidinol-phosphate aminotransferase, partial [Thermoplasmata archaeon]